MTKLKTPKKGTREEHDGNVKKIDKDCLSTVGVRGQNACLYSQGWGTSERTGRRQSFIKIARRVTAYPNETPVEMSNIEETGSPKTKGSAKKTLHLAGRSRRSGPQHKKESVYTHSLFFPNHLFISHTYPQSVPL